MIDHADAAHPVFSVLSDVLFRKGLMTPFLTSSNAARYTQERIPES